MYSGSQSTLGSSADGVIVGYDVVTKSVWSKEGGSNGKIVSYFSNLTDFPASQFIPGMPNTYVQDNGKLTLQEHYKSNGDLVLKKVNIYTINPLTRKRVQGLKSYIPTLIPDVDLAVYRYYNEISEWTYLSREIITRYPTEGVSSLQRTTDYVYGGAGHKNVTAVVTDRSDGSVMRKEFTYPGDLNTGVYAEMSSKNISSSPVEERILINNNVVSSSLSTYKKHLGNYVLEDIFQFKGRPVAELSFTMFNGVTQDYRYQKKYHISKTDSSGNVLEFTDDKGLLNVYLWDASRSHLMAHVIGIPYAQLGSFAGLSCQYSSASLYANLRAVSANAEIKAYSYIPWYGVTEITDGDQSTRFFKYDAMGRLRTVSDEEGSILKKFSYSYRK